MKALLYLLILISFLVFPKMGLAAEDARFYHMAIQSARAGDLDFAFMRYRNILMQYPKSRYREQALFAQGEYFYLLPQDTEARKAFERFIEEYPDAEAKLFALAYLLKIAEREGQQEMYDAYATDIVTLKQVSLVFRDFKEYEYLSPMNREHKAVFHIDTIEFIVEGELFAKISY